MDSTVQPDENLTCDDCGRFGAVEFDGRKLCPDCCASSGACCAESDGEESDCRAKETNPSASKS